MTHRYTFRTNNDELAEYLNDLPNKSAFIEACVTKRMEAQKGGQMELERSLTPAQQTAYDWLVDRVGVGGMMGLEVAKTRIAESTNMSINLVMSDVIKPLENKGKIRIITGIQTVSIEVRS